MIMDCELNRLVSDLALMPHPEGGFYRETYRSHEKAAGLPARFIGTRCFSTAILYALVHGSPSRLHRIKSDELWHFYAGAPLEVIAIDPEGRRVDQTLGGLGQQGQQFQICVPAGHWFGARVAADSGWSLVGCTVSPGFEFSDLELGGRSDLLRKFPAHSAIIKELTTAE